MQTLLLFTLCAAIIIPAHLQKVFYNVHYGTDSAQVMDIYEPSGNATKVLLLIHGGAWITGSKDEMKSFVDVYRREYPNYIIANMNYRLGNPLYPGYPRQLIDVDNAVKFIRSRNNDDLRFALVGGSAGAHLSMLYSYMMDNDGVVKAVVDVVGPSDLTDKNVNSNLLLIALVPNFVGPYTYRTFPEIFTFASPVFWISSSSPPTIGFYGDKDPLIPNTQMSILQDRLNKYNVTNEFYRYPGGHFDWAPQYKQDMYNKSIAFLNQHL